MARVLRRGDVVWANLHPTKGHEQSGTRPVIVISYDVFNKCSGTVIAIALTSQAQKAHFPITLELNDLKLSKKSWAKISQIRTLSTIRLGKRIGCVTAEELEKIIEGLNEIIS